MFHICGPCDHGQIYCGEACREAGDTRRKRKARAAHQATPDGRLDHRDHQRTYRERCRMRARVTDQGIEKVDESEKVIAFAEHSAESPAALTSVSRNPVDGLVEAASGMVRCAFCRRESCWVRRGFLRRRRVVPEAGAG